MQHDKYSQASDKLFPRFCEDAINSVDSVSLNFKTDELD